MCAKRWSRMGAPPSVMRAPPKPPGTPLAPGHWCWGRALTARLLDPGECFELSSTCRGGPLRTHRQILHNPPVEISASCTSYDQVHVKLSSRRRKMMKFALLIYESPDAFASRKGDGSNAYTGAWRAYHEALGASARSRNQAQDRGMSGSDGEKVERTVERVARESYGRLVAYLSVHTQDLARAEDALSEALLKALTVWPRDGVPQNPEAWLLTTARNSIIDFFRHQRVVLDSEPNLLLLTQNSAKDPLETNYPDERLKLLFVCAHPAIDPAMHP